MAAVSAEAPDLVGDECRAARRLARLFRIERNDRFDHRPAAMVARLIARRGALITALMALDDRRRAAAAPASIALSTALAELRRDTERARAPADARLQRIFKDLRISRGEGLATGLRAGDGGRHLGTS
jgi:hypothetical protein